MNVPNVSVASDAVVTAGSGAGASVPQTKSTQAANAAEVSGELSNEQIKSVIGDIQKRLESMSISIDFTTYGAHNERIAVVVSDQVTGKVIREIPPKELQQLYVKMNELIGMIFNGSA